MGRTGTQHRRPAELLAGGARCGEQHGTRTHAGRVRDLILGGGSACFWRDPSRYRLDRADIGRARLRGRGVWHVVWML